MGFEDKINKAFSKGIDDYLIAVHYVKQIGTNDLDKEKKVVKKRDEDYLEQNI